MSTKIETYVAAIISNPEWIKSVAAKYNAVQTTDQRQIVCKVTTEQVASAVAELEVALIRRES
jgi:hypothetical protein